MPAENELTERELDILRLVATGITNKEIASRLQISANTVKVHLRNVFSKVNVNSRTEATLYALSAGLVDTQAIVRLDEGEQALDGEAASKNKPGRSWLWLLSGVFLLFILAIAVFLFLSRPGSPINPPGTSSPPRRWQALADLPSPRAAMAATVYENRLYIIGGETSEGVTASVLRYDPLADRWEELAPLPQAVADAQAVLLGERIFLPGGRLPDGEISAGLQVYDPRSDRWEVRAALPREVSGYAAAASEGRLYLFGGWNGHIFLADVNYFDPFADRWYEASEIPARRAFACAVVVEGKIFLIGGFEEQHYLTDNLVYSPVNDMQGAPPWEKRAPLPAGRARMRAVFLAGQIYLAGGAGGGNPEEALPLWQYSLREDHWLPFEAPPLPPGSDLAWLPLENRLHAIGGRGPAGLTAQHQAYQAVYTALIPIIP